MDYDVFVTPDAKEDLEGFIYYLLVEKKADRQQRMCWMILRQQNEVCRHWPVVSSSVTIQD